MWTFRWTLNTIGPAILPILLLSAAGRLAAQSCVAAPPGLVSWWPGDGHANDIAGQNPGTLRGDTTFAAGKVGDAFSFSGAGEVVVADKANLNVQQLTMDAWVFPTTREGARVDIILNKELPTSATTFTIQYEMGIRGTFDSLIGHTPAGNFAFFLGGLAGLPNDYRSWVDSFGAVPLNTWTHVAVTFDGSTAVAYVNGVATRTITGLTGALPTTTGSLKIGSRSDPFVTPLPDERFNGRIDEVEIFNRALAAAEIQAIFSAGAAGKCKPRGPVLSVTPALDFGRVGVGQFRDLNLRIQNVGTETLTVTSISTSSQQFQVVSPLAPFQVSVSGEQVAVIRFQPVAMDAQAATLTMTSSDPNRAAVTVSLSGQGIAGPAIAVSTQSVIFSAQTGTNPPPQTFTVRNSGIGALHYQVSANRPWLSVSPSSGSSTGAANLFTVSVNTAGLPAGEYTGEVRVSGTGDSAQAVPAILAVRLSLTEVATVSAATFQPGGSLAPESIASAFGVGLAAGTEIAGVIPLPNALAGASVIVKDSLGTERLAPLFFVSPNQINFLVPEGTQVGPASMTVISQGQVAGTGTLQIAAVAPGLFTANVSGRGVAAALALRVGADGSQTVQLVFQCGATPGSCVAQPIDFGPESDQVFLLLFGTGIRRRSSLSAVSVTVGGEAVEVLAAVAQGEFVGLDQVNVRLPRALMGSGEVNVVLSADNRNSNTVTVSTGR